MRGPRYNSFVVISEDSSAKRFEDLRGARCVVNEMTSHSGMNALRGLMAPLHRGGRFFSEVAISGSHVASLATVAAGAADVAAIDCVTYELLRRYRPESLRRVLVEDACDEAAHRELMRSYARSGQRSSACEIGRSGSIKCKT
jgi:ABC-type phosphate/phosphonate transport system substrate-binding protein